MQVGSLVEVIFPSGGDAHVDGVRQPLAQPISIGEILTISDIIPGLAIDGNTVETVILSEKWHKIHPIVGIRVSYQRGFFREIQRPMEINLESIISQSKNI